MRKEEMGRENANETTSSFSSSRFLRYGRSRVQDEMTLIRLITIIIRLNFAESKGESCDLMRPKKNEEKVKEEKKPRNKRKAHITIFC